MKKFITIILLQIITGIGYTAVTQPPVISRAQWGADESLRLGGGGSLSSSVDELKGADEGVITPAIKRKIADDYLVTNFPNEFRTDSVIRTRNNKSILRPVQINNQKTRIVIHHTARSLKSDPTYSDIITEIQDIYRFHTLSRKRGDIGYNYIIGPDGSIFEGRFGGPSAIGAHVVNNNSSSIGISLMGNFQNEEPTPQQLQATIDLVARLSDRYTINLNSKLVYHESSNEDPYIVDHTDHALIGHKDAGDTACPGKNLHNKLPSIREQATLIAGSKTPKDNTPIITDPVKYYIPSTSYQLSIPWSSSNEVNSCRSASEIWSIKKCTLSGGYLTLNLNKLANQSHQGYHKFIIQTPKGQNYLYLSLQYQVPTKTLTQPISSIPTRSDYHTGSRINVMLYNLSTTTDLWIVSCNEGCLVNIGSSSVKLKAGTKFQLTKKNNKLIFWRANTQYIIPNLSISPLGSGVVTITNFNRPEGDKNLNSWRGTLTWSVSQYKPIGKPITTGMTITNTLRMDDYMRGIVLTKPNTPQSYHDALYIASHTNTRYWGNSITDNPRIHQYYGGANAESLDYKWQLSHDTLRTTILKNGNNLTYAPWFECSDGITRNGVVDVGICPDGNLSGPGVGMSRLGALILSQRGYNTHQIIEYYYPGITFDIIN